MDKKKKKIIISVSVIAVIVALVIAAASIIKANQNELGSGFVYSLMPNSVEHSVGDNKSITVYKRKNKDYDVKTQSTTPMDAVEFYYYDDDGKEVVIDGQGILEYNGKNCGTPYFTFLEKALEKFSVMRKAFRIITPIIIVAAVSGAIVLWFFKWSKKQDLEKEKKYGDKKKHKRTKK